MGQQERAREERRSAKKTHVGSKRGGGYEGGQQYAITGRQWAHLMALVSVMADRGGAVRIGYTRDGGALALGLYADDETGTEYIRPSEDGEVAIDEVAAGWLGNSYTTYTEWRDAALRLMDPRTENTPKRTKQPLEGAKAE